MTKLYCAEATGAYGVSSPTKAPGDVVQAQLKRMRATFVSTGANNAIGDTISLGRLPQGAVFAYGVQTQSVSGSTATISIGNASDPAKYKAAAAQTTVDTPTLFGKASAIDDAGLTAEEEVLATIGALILPAGTYMFDIFFSSRTS